MKYQLSNGKNITIPDEEIKKGVELLGLTPEESIQMYLEDNGHAFNYEQEELEELNRGKRIDHGSTDKTKRKRVVKPKTVKNSDEKKSLYSFIKTGLEKYASENNYTLSIVINEKKLKLAKDNISLTIDIVQNHKTEGKKSE